MSLRPFPLLALSSLILFCGPRSALTGGQTDGGDAGPTVGRGEGGSPDGGTPKDGGPGVDAGNTGMRAVGNRLQRDGVDFVAHGFNMVGLLTPIACGCSQGTGQTANAHLTSAWIHTLTTPPWSANMLRFQVSQRALADPTLCTTATARQAYLTEIQAGVATVRQATSPTFPIILSMQDQSIGCGNVDPLPSTMTQKAWDVLVPLFKDDPYVLFELFNEPQNVYSNAAQWVQWFDAGGGGGLTCVGGAVIGHQELVNHIRSALGADNVLIADVANHAEHANGAIPLSELNGRGIVYGIHPYTYDPQGMGVANNVPATQAAYAQRWQFVPGQLDQPILITEWNYTAADCGSQRQQYSPPFLGYCSGGITMVSLNKLPVGLLAHAGDVLGTVIASWNSNGTLSPVSCPDGGTGWGLGSGVDLHQYFASLVDSGR